MSIKQIPICRDDDTDEGWRKIIVSLQNLSRSKQRKGIFWNRGKIAMKQQSKGSKLEQTCGRPENAIFVQKV